MPFTIGFSYKTIILSELFATVFGKFIFDHASLRTAPNYFWQLFIHKKCLTVQIYTIRLHLRAVYWSCCCLPALIFSIEIHTTAIRDSTWIWRIFIDFQPFVRLKFSEIVFQRHFWVNFIWKSVYFTFYKDISWK